MKKVLIISYYWPPNAGVGCRRWVNYSYFLQKNGIEPILYVPENPEYDNIDNGYEEKIKTIYTLKNKIWEPFSFYKRFLNKKNISPGILIDSNKGLKNKFSKWIRANFFIPDSRLFWINSSVNFLSNFLNDNPVDAVISTGPPHSMHLIALNLKRRLNLKWIADFRDPWTDIEYFDKLNFWDDSRKRHFNFEKTVLNQSDLVLTVSESWSKRFAEIGAKRVEFLFNGYDLKEYPTKIIQNKKFRIGHFGLFNELRDHNSLWEAINIEMKKKHDDRGNNISDNLELFFSGPNHLNFNKNLKQRNLYKYLIHREWLAHDEVLKEMMTSDLLLITQSKTQDVKGRLPAKFFEYLGAKRTILGIGDKNSDLAKLISNLNCGFFHDFNDVKGIGNSIMKSYRDKYIDGNKKNIDFSIFSWENQSNKLIKILNSL